MTAAANDGADDLDRHVSVEELMTQQGVVPIASVSELADDNAFESDEELEEFLADLYASRRASVG